MHVEAMKDGVFVRVGPQFDAQRSEQLERNLEVLAPIQHLVVDFAETRQVDDYALAQLAGALRRVAVTIAFRGLSLHHQRILRYLGRKFTLLQERQAT